MNNEIKLQQSNFILKANQPVLLNNPEVIWKLESGVVGLFAVVMQDETAISERRYLFSISAGEALFALDTEKVKSIVTSNYNDINPKSYGILAVPLEETCLSKITQSELEDWTINEQNEILKNPISKEFIALTENWIEKFSIFPGVVNPSTILDDSAAYDWDILSDKLAQLHSDFVHHIHQLEEQEHEEQLTQFHAREELNRQVTIGAVGELASVLKPKSNSYVAEDTDLLMAAGAVGHALGITIQPPAKSEDLKRVKEPAEAIARASRIRMRRVILTPGWWNKDCGPLLAFVDGEKRPVAILPVSGNKYEIFDPANRQRVEVNKFLKNNELEPIAYMFYRPFGDKMMTIVEVLQFAFRGRIKDVITLLLVGVAVSLLGMLTPQATAIIIDNAIPDADRGLLFQIGFGLLAGSFGQVIFRLTQSFATLRLETTADAVTQSAIWDRLLSLRMSFFRAYSTGDLQSRVSAISQIRQHLSTSTLQTIFTSFFSLLNLALMFSYNSQLALVAVAVALVVIIVTTFSAVFTRRKMRPLQEIQGEISGLLVQLIGGVSKLRIAGAENRAFAYWARMYSKQLKLMLSTQFIEDLLEIFNILLPTVCSMVIFSMTVQLMGQGGAASGGGAAGEPLTAGKFMAFNSAFGTFIGAASSLSNTLISVLEVSILWERAKPILEAMPEVDTTKADPGKLSGKVELEHISFRYRTDGPLTLDNISIKAQPGEFIALVGPSGSGKSTIIRLLLGFDTPELGTIYYDGQDMSGLDISSVRRQMGVVLQQGRINTGSIFENISSGALVTIDEAWEAARMAGFADDIQGMPMGMHTVISEGGTNLSGGQRQRLLISRALVLKPKILIFDEATSALDNRTQAIVSESMDKLQVTRIVIAHRLSTIRNAKQIYVIDAGRVVQQGSFDELASQAGLFANLMSRQMT
jgi:NHLM bacteriocin system ABC transporter ATP-binding protein